MSSSPFDGLPVIAVAEAECAVVVLFGELDLTSSPALTAVLDQAMAATGGDVVVNAASVGFADCAGVRPLHDAALSLAIAGRRLVFLHPSRPMRRLVVLTGLDLFADVCG